jgi:pyruvate,water dikinase
MTPGEENVLHQISGPGALWSRVNTAESIVGVQTPLSWSFWDDGGELGFRRAYCELGFLPRAALSIPDAIEQKFTAIFYGRAATNVSAFRAALDAMPFASTDAAEQSFFSSRSNEARAESPRRRRLASSLRLPAAALGLPRRLAKLRADSESFWRESLEALPGEDVPATRLRFERALERFSDEVAAQIVASTVATLFSGRLQALIARNAASLGEGAEELELRLLGGFGDMEEIGVSADLWKVAREGRELTGFLSRHGFLLRQSARYVPLRVIAKAAFQQTFDVARAAARQIGAAFAADGRLDRPDDVFYLTREELAHPPADARARVESRSALHRGYQELDLPLEWSGMPRPFALRTSEPTAPMESLQGLGVSPGVAEGTARVVLDPSEGELLPGEILVCSITDPSWSSYFLLAAGVVIDVGGPLSHGAIVARELGIPCVINTVDGTRRLHSGDRLRIDGSSGRVEVLT